MIAAHMNRFAWDTFVNFGGLIFVDALEIGVMYQSKRLDPSDMTKNTQRFGH